MSEAQAVIAKVQYELMAKRAYNAAGELVHPMLLDIHRHKAEDMAATRATPTNTSPTSLHVRTPCWH